MTLYFWIMIALITAKLALLFPLIGSIRESLASIRQSNKIIESIHHDERHMICKKSNP